MSESGHHHHHESESSHLTSESGHHPSFLDNEILENKIFINRAISNSFEVTVKDPSGVAVDVGPYYSFLYVASCADFSDSGNILLVLDGTIVDAPNGKIRFNLTQAQSSQLSGDYAYLIKFAETNLVEYSDVVSGTIRFFDSIKWASGLDWKPDAVSGQHGQVFNLTNTSGIVYYAGGPVYKDPVSGITLIFAHTEEGYWSAAPLPAPRHSASIRLKVSLDNGDSIYDAGPIIRGTTSSTPSLAEEFADQIKNISLCVRRDDYLYIYYYTEKLNPNDRDNRLTYGFLCVARAPYNEVIQAAANKQVSTWSKYYNGSFGQPGLGGSATNLVTSYDLSLFKSVGFYSTELDETVILFTKATRDLDTNLPLFPFDIFFENGQIIYDTYAIYSKDGFNFSYPERVTLNHLGGKSLSIVGDYSNQGLVKNTSRLLLTSGELDSPINLQTVYYDLTPEARTTTLRSFGVERYSPVYKVGFSLDRGQLHPYMATLHYIMEQAKIQEASAYYYQNPSALIADSRWKNMLQSYANSSTELSGNYPDSFDDYLNYELGRDFHKFYNHYTTQFNRHKTSPLTLSMDGPLITSHALGSLIYNSKFDKRGSLTASSPTLITSNLSSVYDFRAGSNVFSSSGTASGTYVASSILNYGSSISEYRNSGVLDHIELCQTSGSSPNNLFSIIDINYSGKPLSSRNKLLSDNVLIRQVSNNGFGRIIFDVSKYSLSNPLYGTTRNFLIPNHEFEFSIRTLISDFDGLVLNNGSVGVWIHTKPENNFVWSFVAGKGWIQHSASGITREQVVNQYSNIFNLNRTNREKPGSDPSKFVCLNYLNKDNPNRKNDVMASFLEEDFSELKVKFNTFNKTCNYRLTPPREYVKNFSSDVHRIDQNYVIEVFTVPNQLNKNFTLFYGVNMMDLTLNKMSKPFVTGIRNGSHFGEIYCKEFRVDLSKEHILNIIKYFNQIAGAYESSKVDNFKGYASRVASSTSGIYEVSGGSRINYVEDPNWGANSPNANTLRDQITIIN